MWARVCWTPSNCLINKGFQQALPACLCCYACTAGNLSMRSNFGVVGHGSLFCSSWPRACYRTESSFPCAAPGHLCALLSGFIFRAGLAAAFAAQHMAPQ